MVEGAPAKDQNGDPLYCFDNGLTPSGCRSGQKCTLPGPRHGHSATQLYIQGTLVYSIFGGESTHLMRLKSVESSNLTNDMHIAFFEGATAADQDGKQIACQGACELSATWINTWTTCDNSLGRFGPVCPDKRRDAAISVMENTPANNGRLLIFGGMGGTGTTAEGIYRLGMKSYLDKTKNTKNVKAFNDLWYVKA